MKINPETDLVLERDIDVPVELVWKAWTEPEHLMKWFCPKPWQTVECEIDLRPGGKFYTAMCSPEGEKFPNTGCYLEVVKNQKLVWTDALKEDFRPTGKPNDCFGSYFTAHLFLTRTDTGTSYKVVAMHGDAESSKKHVEIGFYEGWNAALNQMIEAIKAGEIK